MLIAQTPPERISKSQLPRILLPFEFFGLLVLATFGALAIGDALTAVPWCDEAWLSNPALTFLRKGYFGTPILTAYGWGPPQHLLDIQHARPSCMVSIIRFQFDFAA